MGTLFIPGNIVWVCCKDVMVLRILFTPSNESAKFKYLIKSVLIFVWPKIINISLHKLCKYVITVFGLTKLNIFICGVVFITILSVVKFLKILFGCICDKILFTDIVLFISTVGLQFTLYWLSGEVIVESIPIGNFIVVVALCIICTNYFRYCYPY